jgi:hypothetical protein
MSTIRPELIAVTSIRILKSNINTTDEYMENPLSHDGVEVKMGQQTAFQLEEKNVRIRLSLELVAKRNQNEPVGLTGDYLLEFILHVDNLDEFIVENNDISKSIDIALNSTLIGIIFSTARGIIYERTAATLLNGVILPVIAPTQLI